MLNYIFYLVYICLSVVLCLFFFGLRSSLKSLDNIQEKLPVATGNPALNEMEKLLKEADITPANLSKLSAGFQKLGSAVDKAGEISDPEKATGEDSTKTDEATAVLGTVKDAYMKFATSLKALDLTSETGEGFHDQVQALTKNLTSLNTIYQLEMQESNNHLKALNSFYAKLSTASAAMSISAEDAKKAQQQIATLATNLSKLNQVYGVMFTSMQRNDKED